MTEAEAMQAAREFIGMLHELAYLIEWNLDVDTSFYEAQKIAIDRIREMEDEEFQSFFSGGHDSPYIGSSIRDQIKWCFPQLTDQSVVAAIKWKHKRDREHTRRLYGRHYRRGRNKGNLWRIFGEAYARAEGLASHTERELDKNRVFEDVEEMSQYHAIEHNRLLATQRVFQHMINTRYSGRRFILPKMATYRPHTSSSRSRRSPVRSAAKSGGDDNGGDSESDQGEPPRPVLTVPSLSTSPTLTTPQRNNSTLSRTPHPCRWSLDWRWAA
ncbi:MAG: hypothetical protein EOM17_12410 [Synergistales bacterium]|nr:hypothetical protein [Synergistales bacterium]